jgi:hypothetical protein
MERQLDNEYEYSAAQEHLVRSHQYFADFAAMLRGFDSHMLYRDTFEGLEYRNNLYKTLWFPIHQFLKTLEACQGACQEADDLLEVMHSGNPDQVIIALMDNMEDGLLLSHFTESLAHQLIAEQFDRDEDAFEAAYLTSL